MQFYKNFTFKYSHRYCRVHFDVSVREEVVGKFLPHTSGRHPPVHFFRVASFTVERVRQTGLHRIDASPGGERVFVRNTAGNVKSRGLVCLTVNVINFENKSF